MNEIKIYLEIKNLAVDENGNRCPAGIQVSLGETEKEIDYVELTKNVNLEGLLNMAALDELGVKLEDVKVITPEEYEAKYEDDEEGI